MNSKLKGTQKGNYTHFETVSINKTYVCVLKHT